MKISAIIPNYNHAAFLPKAIESILTQTHDDFELVLVDDCSTDNSREIILQALPDKRVKSIFQTRNSGPVAATEAGIANSSGDFIFVGSADDFVSDPTFFESVSYELQHNPGVAAVYGKTTVFSHETGAELWQMGAGPHWGSFTPEECLSLFLEGRMFVPGSSVVMRREVQAQLGGFDPELGPQSDYFLNHAAGAYGGVVFLDRVVAHMRHSETSYSRQDDEAFFRRHALVEKKLRAAYAPLPVDPALIAKWRFDVVNGRLGMTGQNQFIDAVESAFKILPPWERQNLPERFLTFEAYVAQEIAPLRALLDEKSAAAKAIFDEIAGPI